MRRKQNHIKFFKGDRKMAILRKMLLILFCVFFVGGCYEDETVLTINSDGSGTLKQKAVLWSSPKDL